jgi:hypothetical protein
VSRIAIAIVSSLPTRDQGKPRLTQSKKAALQIAKE